MPRATAALATRTPIAPRPRTPSFLPLISGPANCFLPLSVSFAISSLPLRACDQSAASTIFLEERRRAAITSSLTALAFAPGVLKTTMPSSVHLSRGILFVPAPALAMALRFFENSILCISALLTSMPSASSIVSVILKFSSSCLRPFGEIAFKVAILYISVISFIIYIICFQVQICP